MFCLAALVLLPSDVRSAYAFDPWTLCLLAGVGITATIGQLFLTKAFAAGPPARVSVVGLSQVAFSALADSLIWQRRLEASTLAGMALIVAPTAWLLLRSGAAHAPPIIPDDEILPPPLE
jgi:drug/metabolite transporter (DMT)-like permease